jgi:hypothetical protein
MSSAKTTKGAKLPEKVVAPEPKQIKTNPFVKQIQKRDGTLVPFDMDKIVNAIHKAMAANNEGSLEEAEMVANKVLADLVRITKKYKNFLPTVEGVQDSVEKELILSEYVQTAKGYILYREKRSEQRKMGLRVPEKVKTLTDESRRYFKSQYSEFIFFRSYSRFNDAEGRRETWLEAVDRYFNFMRENIGDKYSEKDYAELREAVLKMEVMS